MWITLLFNVNNLSNFVTFPQCDEMQVHIKKSTHCIKISGIAPKIDPFKPLMRCNIRYTQMYKYNQFIAPKIMLEKCGNLLEIVEMFSYLNKNNMI